MAPRVDQFQGCIIGCAVGDAIGAPVEAKAPAEVRAFIKAHVRPKSFEDIKRPGFKFGQYTDDGQLTRELMLSLVENGGFDPEDFAGRIADMFARRKIVGFGRSTQSAATRLIENFSWNEAGEPAPAAGNGSAMRASPIGLYHWNEPGDALLSEARDQGIITHTNPLCTAGAVAVAGATAFALDPDRDPYSEDWWMELSELVSDFDEEFADGILSLWKWRDLDITKVFEHIKAFEGDPSQINAKWNDAISPYVVSSVLWSLYAFMTSPFDYWDSLCVAMWPGGDVDTTAAMTGAISGAKNGLAAIPEEIAKQIHDRGTWGYQPLCDLAAQLHEMTTG